MHDCYDWLKDIVLPLVVGAGSVWVGFAAWRVARQSHQLAEQVRNDEANRAKDAARDRYREQLFRIIEPAAAAMLDHSDAIEERRSNGGKAARGSGANFVSAVMSRLHLLSVVTNAEDEEFVEATIEAYGRALKNDDLDARADLITALALGIARLLDEDRDIEQLVQKARALGRD